MTFKSFKNPSSQENPFPGLEVRAYSNRLIMLIDMVVVCGLRAKEINGLFLNLQRDWPSNMTWSFLLFSGFLAQRDEHQYSKTDLGLHSNQQNVWIESMYKGYRADRSVLWESAEDN